MTIRHLNDRHYDWKHMIDYVRFPRTTPTLSRERDSRALRLHPSDRINPASASETGQPRPTSSGRSLAS